MNQNDQRAELEGNGHREGLGEVKARGFEEVAVKEVFLLTSLPGRDETTRLDLFL